jgi:hypothetical protein
MLNKCLLTNLDGSFEGSHHSHSQHFSGSFSNDSFEFAFLEETILN